MNDQTRPQGIQVTQNQAEDLGDELGEQLQKHRAIDAVHHVAELMLGPVAGMLVAHTLHLADVASEMSSPANNNTNKANQLVLNQPHLTLNGKPTSKPVLILDANDDPAQPGKKLKKKPSEHTISNTEKRYHERAFTQGLDLTPAIASPFDLPGLAYPGSSSARKRKRITPI